MNEDIELNPLDIGNLKSLTKEECEILISQGILRIDLFMAITNRGQAKMTQLLNLSEERLQEICNECKEVLQQYPMEFPQVEIPPFGLIIPDEKEQINLPLEEEEKLGEQECHE